MQSVVLPAVLSDADECARLTRTIIAVMSEDCTTEEAVLDQERREVALVSELRRMGAFGRGCYIDAVAAAGGQVRMHLYARLSMMDAETIESVALLRDVDALGAIEQVCLSGALIGNGGERVVEPLLQLSESPCEEARMNAVLALESHPRKSVHERVREMRDRDSSARVRRNAENVLLRWSTASEPIMWEK